MMGTQRYMRIMKIVIAINMIILVVIATHAQPAQVGELSPTQTLWLGTGTLFNPAYPGSDELLVKVVPYVKAEYSTHYFDFFAGVEDGIGVWVKAPDLSDLSLSVAINPLGVRRDPKLTQIGDVVLRDADQVKRFLDGTPTVKSPVELFGRLALSVPFGTVSSTVSFLPITADYPQANLSDKNYTGLTVSADVETNVPLTPQVFLRGSLGATWMNKDYTEAFFGVAYPTTSLKTFTTGDSNDVHASFAVVSFFTDHIGVIVSGSASLLLGDAADSPLTKRAFQPEIAALVFYRF